MSELLLLQEQARSMVRLRRLQERNICADALPIAQSELAMSYSHTLAESAQSGQMFGVRRVAATRERFCCTHTGLPDSQESLQKLALKRDPRTETLWCVLGGSARSGADA